MGLHYTSPNSAAAVPQISDPYLALADAQTFLQRSTPARLNKDIDTALAMIGQAHGADRAVLFRIKDMVFVENTHEWLAPGIKPMQQGLKETPYYAGEAFWAAFRRDGVLLLSDIASVPAGCDMHKMLVEQEIKSLVAAPIWSADDIAGFVALDYCKAPRVLDARDGALLRSFAASLGAALDLQCSDKQRTALSAELKTVQDRVSTYVRALPELLIKADRNGVVIGFHQRPPLILALNPVEVIGLPPEAFLPPHVARIARLAMAQVDANGRSETHDYSITINGQRRRFALHATRRRKAKPAHLQGYLFVIRDITATYHQTHRTRLLARAADLSSNLVMLTDENRRLTWMNPAAVSRTGISLEDALGRHPRDVLRLEQGTDNSSHDLYDVLTLTDYFKKDVAAKSWNGLPYWVDLTVQPLHESDGELEGYLVVASDISLHKLSESRALRERTNTMEMSEDTISISQPDGHFTYMNPALRRILNIPADAPIEGLTWNDVNPPTVNDRFSEILPVLYAQGQWNGEIAMPQQGAPDRYFDVAIWVQDDGSFLTIGRETTARKATEKHNALLREQLQIAQSRQQMAQLAGGLAHDIFNYMAVNLHAIEALKPQIGDASDENLARMEAATTQVLSLAKTMSKLGKRSVAYSVTDICPIVKQAAELISPSLGGDAVLTLDLPDTPIDIVCDRTELMQALVNLLINARDALQDGTDTNPQITVHVRQAPPVANNFSLDVGTISTQSRYVQVDICDTGIGLCEDSRTKMFDPYFTTKGENGTGLGMSIVSRILLENKAALRIQSEQGKGTCMQIFWPIAAPDTAAQSELSESAQALSLKGLSVLLVDHQEAGLIEMSHVLSRNGAEVVSCPCPEDAIEALMEDPNFCDVIVINGNGAPGPLAKLTDHADLNCPIILTTTDKKLHFATHGMQNENITLLQKPFSASALVTLLHDATLRRH
ncbi:PAS domain S-box-containing protein [Roseinatronobacter thiooxidans]|uniref:histidine kinase n=2 Tax=Roseinatronobacter thiooxidans TaxID=121821 RepID=A0A2W7QL50_9RHOB|nr:PAS domain-containing protein [Roseinatronobacter thiooxidans]PZX41979.1 PAS domain S-box-containing protein [Roseinatronobacter thiooxidans]